MNIRVEIRQYTAEARRFYPACGIALTWREVVRLALLWRRWHSKLPGRATPWGDRRPWLNFPAFEHLAAIVRPGMKVFEYGMGGSTLYFASRGCEVTSVEHDAKWFKAVADEMAKAGYADWRGHCHPPIPDPAARGLDPSDPAACVSSDAAYAGHTFRAYAAAIGQFPLFHFHLVLVDGRARPACIEQAADHVRPAGCLVVDNSDIACYARAIKALTDTGWTSTVAAGPGPYSGRFWATTFLQAPDTPSRRLHRSPTRPIHQSEFSEPDRPRQRKS